MWPESEPKEPCKKPLAEPVHPLLLKRAQREVLKRRAKEVAWVCEELLPSFSQQQKVAKIFLDTVRECVLPIHEVALIKKRCTEVLCAVFGVSVEDAGDVVDDVFDATKFSAPADEEKMRTEAYQAFKDGHAAWQVQMKLLARWPISIETANKIARSEEARFSSDFSDLSCGRSDEWPRVESR